MTDQDSNRSDDDYGMDLDDLCERILDALHRRLMGGPTYIEALVEGVRDNIDTAGFDELDDRGLAELVEELLLDDPLVWISESKLVATYDEFMPGLVFTHRVSADEVARGVLDATPDLIAIDTGIDDDRPRSGADRIEMCFTGAGSPNAARDGSFVGPNGWLDGIDADTVVALRRGRQSVSVEQTTTVGDGAREVDALRAAFNETHRPGQAIETADVVIEAVLRDPAAFRRPVAPLGELLVRAGLRVDASWCGRADEAFETPQSRAEGLKLAELAETYKMDKCCTEALRHVVKAYAAVGTAGEVGVAGLAADLDHGPVVPAFAEWTFDRHRLDNPHLDQFLVALANNRTTRANGLYLGARNGLRRGSAAQAMIDLREAVALDPSAPWAGMLQADLLGDAGEYMRSLQARRRVSGAEHHHHVEYFSRLLRPFLTAGRNDPCPCGSGRKFKQCCTNTARLSIPLRARLRWHQVFSFMMDPERFADIAAVASIVADRASSLSDDQMRGLLGDSFIHDLATVEGGTIHEYLRQRGEVIPADERAWIEAWAAEKRSMYEVLDAGDGWFLGRNVAHGGEVRATLVPAALQTGFEPDDDPLQPGSYVLARLGYVGEEAMVIGTLLTITMRNQPSLLAILDQGASMRNLAAWYGSTMAAPRLTNREGEQIVAIAARFAPPLAGWGEARTVLDRTYPGDENNIDDDIDDDPDGAIEQDRWSEYVDIDEDRVMRAWLRRAGDELIVDTNSVERFDRIREQLLSDGFVLIDISDSRDLDQIRSQIDTGDLPTSPEPPAMTAEVIDQIQDTLEDRWLADSIPAFGGLTPAQALADPTRRADVLRMLDEFERSPSMGMASYDMARMRRKLGLVAP